MRRLLNLILFTFVLSAPAFAMARADGWCELGGGTVSINGLLSPNLVQSSYPGCTVTVFIAGTGTKATLFSDNSGTALGNPFTANTMTGQWDFYVANGDYSIQLSGGGIPTPFTIASVSMFDPLTVQFPSVTIVPPATNQGYLDIQPITYNPYNGAVCHDTFGNVVTQPLPASGSFGPNDAIFWVTTSPNMPTNGSCGAPIPVNDTYGVATNSFMWARGGYTTDLDTFNSVQTVGGMFGTSFTATTYIQVGQSDGVPTPTPNDHFHAGALYWDTGLTALQVFNGSAWVGVGGGGGSGCSPGGSAGNVQFNNGSGGCAGTANLTWNTGSQFLQITAANSSQAGLVVNTGFIQSAVGFVATPATATLFNAIQAPAGGVEALNLTAANYIQSGQSSGVPPITSGDSFHPGALYYDTGLGSEQVYNGSTWVSLSGGGGTGCTVSVSAGVVLFSTGSGCTGSTNLFWNSGAQKLSIAGINATAALDITSGFIQTEGGIVTNVGSWNAYNTNTDGGVLRGQVIQQNTANTLGGYINFVPITYNPNGGGVCHDKWGNVVAQPSPLPGIASWSLGTATSTFSSGTLTITLSSVPAGVGIESQIIGPGIPTGNYIVGISGSNITLAVATNAPETGATLTFFNNNLWEWNAPSSSIPATGCGTPLPANTLYGMNTNGYYFARGGFATDLPYFNSIQSLIGGVFGRALFTSDTFNQTSGVQCATLGTCGGGYYNTGGSSGIPTPLTGDVFHGGAFYWDTSTSKQQLYNGSTWGTLCYTSGTSGRILFDNNAGACGESGSLNWTGSVFQVTGSATFSGSITVASCTGCGGGGGAVSSVSGSGNISVSPTTGATVVSISSTPTFAEVFLSGGGAGGANCGYTGSTQCFFQSSGVFHIDGDGSGHFQSVATNTLSVTSTSTFTSAATFNGGIVVPSGTSSTIFMGSGGSLYLRTFTGTPSCSGVADGWFGYETTTDQLWVCSGGIAHAH